MISHGSRDAYHARKEFGLRPSQDSEKGGPEPVFCFCRFGRTETKLPDGRIVYIAGEHEDYYDPDFNIYNDVVVVHRHGAVQETEQTEEGTGADDAGSENEMSDDSDYDKEYWEDLKREKIKEDLETAALAAGVDPADIQIYGYPADVFPATYFHTATYFKDERTGGNEYVYIIGGLGYGKSPHRKATLVHRLDLQDHSIRRIATNGEAPPPRVGSEKEWKVELQGGRILYTVGSEGYFLSLADMRWSRS
ncbi:hypothetical protein C8A00DRAFT_19337 [Chaetomidium leptoderma]|uniref:Uncharacterized protein n=1 Tax=Chaetomidium leptoderma TaxID=669021 RepID=A0AAN6VCG7_9PEZI|nr:hypothetical protein C8A00DRAFT_19337 [Chaetomidium leptoderma]